VYLGFAELSLTLVSPSFSSLLFATSVFSLVTSGNVTGPVAAACLDGLTAWPLVTVTVDGGDDVTDDPHAASINAVAHRRTSLFTRRRP
jgi:hypothetical protein